MATDPALIHDFAELGQSAGGARGRVVGTGGLCCHGLPTIYPAAAAIIFPVIAASGFWVSGVGVLAVVAVGAGLRIQSQHPDDLGLRRRQRVLDEQRGDDPDRILTDYLCDCNGRSWILWRMR